MLGTNDLGIAGSFLVFINIADTANGWKMALLVSKYMWLEGFSGPCVEDHC